MNQDASSAVAVSNKTDKAVANADSSAAGKSEVNDDICNVAADNAEEEEKKENASSEVAEVTEALNNMDLNKDSTEGSAPLN